MSFLDMRNKLSRRSGRKNEPHAVPQENWRGVNYVDDVYTRPPHQLPFAQNVDLGDPIGAITKCAGYESLIASLGTGGIKGLHAWEHSTGDKLIAAWSNYLYLLSGASGSIAKTSQADWEAGTGTNLDTATSAGDVKIDMGTAFSETDTLTADFNGTHTQTLATGDKVTLAVSGDSGVGRYYIQDVAAGYDPATERGSWNDTASHIVRKLSKTKAGSINATSAAEATGTGEWDVLLLKAVSDALLGNKTISGKLSFCLAVKESYISANDYYHVHVFVTQGDTDNVRGTLLNNYIGATEWPEATRGLEVSGLSLLNVDAQTGDRVVIEIGYRADNISATNYTGTVFSGGTSATDLTDGATDYNKTGWFEFSEDIVNDYYDSGTYTHGAQDISGVKIVNAATITFGKTTPANTTLTFQYRLSIDSGGTWGSWTTISSGDTVIASGTDVSAYQLQWRALFATTDTSATPSLDSVTVAVTVPTAPTGTWTSTSLDQVNAPLTSVLSWVATTPAGTTVTWYARGSSNGTVWGDWREITLSGGGVPLLRYIQIKFILTGTAIATPTVSNLLISYSSSYTQINLLDITPLGRVDGKLTGNRVSMQDYDDRCYCADGLRPFVLYVDADTAVTGTAQSGTGTNIRLAAGASAVDDFFNNAFITTTGGTGSGQTRYITNYNGTTKDATVSAAWSPALADDTTYSISKAVKVRKAGVDAPTVAPTLADSAEEGLPNGAYLGKYTFVNEDGVESNPSPVSASLSVATNKITWTVPVDATTGNTTASRKLYRTKAGAAVYYYVATISDNTTTAYTDNIADASLTMLMLDNNNIPPATCSLVYSFLTYMFYTSGDELWFSKAGGPENVPNITGDIQMNVCPSTILDIKSNPMALIPQGENFIAPITTNSGFIFDSDPGVDTTTMRIIDKNGSLSAWASDICIDPQMRSILVFPTNTGVRLLLPGLQEESIESVPLSRNIQPYFDLSVNRTNMAGVFYNSYYYISMEYRDPTAGANEFITFVYDFRTGEWYGPWEYGVSCYAISNGVLYGGDTAAGKVYKMNTGSSFAGDAIEMIADLPMIAPAGENKTCKFNKFMMMLSSDSVTGSTTVAPKVDERSTSVSIGTLADSYTGAPRPGHNNIRTRKYRIPLARGSTLSYRITDNSTNPFSLQKMITEVEVLPLRK